MTADVAAETDRHPGPRGVTGASPARPLTVLLVADKVGYDGRMHGIGRYFLNIVPALEGCGARVIPCVLRRWDGASAHLEAAGLRVRCLGKGRYDPTTLVSLARLIRREQVDVLHLQDYGATAFGLLAGWFTGVPALVQEHIVPRRLPWVARLTDWLLGWRIGHTSAVSRSVRDYCVAHRRGHPDKTDVLYLGTPRIDSPGRIAAEAAAVRRTLGLPSGATLIGTVTRLHEQKGIRYLLEALPAVLERAPDTYAVIVGGGPQQAELELQARTLGVGPHVRFLGFREDAQAWMASFDLVVMPSQWEGTPQTAFEAMALGKAIVATDVDGLGEVLRHDETARLVPPRDPGRLAQAIAELIARPAERARLADAAREASRAFDSAQTARALVAHYRRLMCAPVKTIVGSRLPRPAFHASRGGQAPPARLSREPGRAGSRQEQRKRVGEPTPILQPRAATTEVRR